MNNIILADNQDITKAGIKHQLAQTGFAGTIRDVSDKKELTEALLLNPESIVVLDYTLFDFSNVEELLIVSTRFKQAHWIFFSDEMSTSFIQRISLEESYSIVVKSASIDEINTALLHAQKHEQYICSRILNFLSVSDTKNSIEKEKQLLTSTEKEILKLIALGKSVKDIAEERFSSIHTIITHKKNIFRKLEVNNVHEATKYALKAGLIDAIEYYI